MSKVRVDRIEDLSGENGINVVDFAEIINRPTVSVSSIFELMTSITLKKTASAYLVRGYWPEYSQQGGGYFYWDENRPKSQHNGGTIISPTVVWDGQKTTHKNFIYGVGETTPAGFGCFVRKERGFNYITEFGAISDWAAGSGFGTGFDNRWVIQRMLEILTTDIVITKWGTGYATCSDGSIFLQGQNSRRVYGYGKLIKMGIKGVFSFNACDDINIAGITIDCQLIPDEAAAGSILLGTRLATNYTFAVSFAKCTNSSVRGTNITNCSWDALVAQGEVIGDGSTANQSVNIIFDSNKIDTVRGSMLWIRAVKTSKITNNYCKNDPTFNQKANAIFVVEWCHDSEVSGNQCYNIGDNSVGIGEPVSVVTAARNRDIRVVNNYSYRTRYHSILIAQGNDVIVEGNIIIFGGVKGEMPGTPSAVVTAGITVLGGGTDPVNHRVLVRGNIIREAYENGIYVYDRPGTVAAAGSTGIVLDGNTIYRAGRPTVVTARLSAQGIRTQLQNAILIKGNNVSESGTDGIIVYGDAIIKENYSTYNEGLGIHVPNDTLLLNKRLSGAIEGNTSSYNKLCGIRVWGKDVIMLNDNTAIGNGRGGAPGTEETIAGATDRGGIVCVTVVHVSAQGNETRNNGGPGVVYRAGTTVRDSGSISSDNGDMFNSVQYKSGIYCEGSTGNLTKIVCITPIFTSTGVQSHPIRGLNCSTDSVVLDPTYTGHPQGIIGLVEKSLFNI